MSDGRSPDHGFLPLGPCDFHDAGEEGLAMRLSTQPSPVTGKAFHFGCLLNAESGKEFLQALATVMAQKFPEKVKWTEF